MIVIRQGFSLIQLKQTVQPVQPVVKRVSPFPKSNHIYEPPGNSDKLCP